MKAPKQKCCICGRVIEGHGHNPWPFCKKAGMKCCDSCNTTVIAERLALAKKENANDNH